MPTYNRSQSILSAVESVLTQTDKDWELIVVDDGSTDSTKQIIEGIGDERVRYTYQQNAGAAAARNYGLSLASGEWVAYLDSDNELLPNYLERMHAHLDDHPEAMFALPRMHRILELYENDQMIKRIVDKDDILTEDITIHDIFMRTFHVDTNGFIHRLQIYKAGIIWDATLPVMEDWDLALSIGERYPAGFVFVNEILCTYYQRFGGDGLRSNSAYADSAKAFEMIYQKHKDDTLMQGQTWYPAAAVRWRQRELDCQNGKLPPYSQFYFMDSSK